MGRSASSRPCARHGRERAGGGRRDPARADLQALGFRINARTRQPRTGLVELPPRRSRPKRRPPSSRCRLWRKRIERGASNACLVLDSNPAYTAPGELGFGALLRPSRLAHPYGPPRRRDGAALPLASAARACFRKLGRCARGRRHGDAHPAARPAALGCARTPARCWRCSLGRTTASAGTRCARRGARAGRTRPASPSRWRGSLEAGFVEARRHCRCGPVSGLSRFRRPSRAAGRADGAAPPRPLPVGRPLRAQPAAAGAAEAVEQGDLGARRPVAPGGRAARAAERQTSSSVNAPGKGRSGARPGSRRATSEDGVTLYLGGGRE